jgi:hypothetical protein
VHAILSVEYATTPEQLEAFCEGVRELVRRHPHTRKEDYYVHVNQFSPSSIDILLAAWLDVSDWATELRERQRLLVDTLRVAERLGVRFAYPTQTVNLRQDGVPVAPSHANVHPVAPLKIEPLRTAEDYERVLSDGRTAAEAVLRVSLEGNGAPVRAHQTQD